MANNTTFQYVLNGSNSVVQNHVVTALGATLQSLTFTGGTFTANGATAVTVVEPTITANSVVVITLKTVGGTVGAIPAIKTITAGTGFTVAGTASDTSVYNYLVIG